MKEFKFNIQLFADGVVDPNTQTTGKNTTGNDLSSTMKTFYKTSLLENARAKLYFNQFGQKQPLPKNNGKKVEWRKFEAFAKQMTPLTEGVTPDGHNITMSKIEAEINQYGDYVTVSDRLELEAVDPIITCITEETGAEAGEVLDTITRDVVVQGTHVIYGGGKTSRAALTAADKITPTLIDQAFTHLKKMKAPTINNDYIAIIHPSVAYDLRESSDWLDVHKYAQPGEIFNGEIGKLHGVRFIETTEQKIWKTGSNPAVYATTIFGKDAWGIVEPSAEALEIIVKQKGSAGTADPLDQRGSVGFKASHAAKILYDERLVRLETGSFYSATDEAN